jgi:hypothetical protein
LREDTEGRKKGSDGMQGSLAKDLDNDNDNEDENDSREA